MKLNQFYIDNVIKMAIEEDINYIDVAADYLIDDESRSDAYFIAKDSGVLAGLDVAIRVFQLMDDTFTYKAFFKDGDIVNDGDIIIEFNGYTSALLKAERTALNLIQLLSGTATQTRRAVDIVKDYKACIVDTRKTIPGLRALQKYAVTMGGGKNHRFNLSSAAMLKDNHIDASGGITNAVRKLRNKMGHLVCIEVETRTLEEVQEALDNNVEYIMLDNMDYDTMSKAVLMNNAKAVLEASGGITLDTLKDVAKTGVDIISIGALTHSVKAFDISMKIKN